MKICAVEDCDRKVHARGWCNAHYSRWQKHGDIQADKPIQKRRSTEGCCSVAGCERNDVLARGWCSAHYARWRTMGDVMADKPIRSFDPDRGCKVEGCDGDHMSNGWCQKHYWRWKRHGSPHVLGKKPNGYYDGVICKHEDCDEPATARDMCGRHRTQENYRKNRGRYIAHARRRAEHLKNATPNWVNEDKIEAIYEKAKWIENVTGVKHHVDHIDPVLHDKVCGLHIPANLQIVESDYNYAKNNSFNLGVGNTPIREQV